MPRNPRALEQVMEVSRKVSGNVKYPIRNFGQLMKAVGGKEDVVEVFGRQHKVGDIKRFVADDYFPIDSEEDLIAKIHDMQLRAGVEEAADVEFAEERKDLPADAGEPEPQEAKAPGSGNVPHVRGKKRQQ